MRTTIVFAFLACIFALAAVEGKKCDKGSDCESDECCVKFIGFLPSKCQKLRQKGEACINNISDLKEGEKYRFTCPCASGLRCHPQAERDHNGVLNFLNDKCQEEKE